MYVLEPRNELHWVTISRNIAIACLSSESGLQTVAKRRVPGLPKEKTDEPRQEDRKSIPRKKNNAIQKNDLSKETLRIPRTEEKIPVSAVLSPLDKMDTSLERHLSYKRSFVPPVEKRFHQWMIESQA